MSQKLDNIFVHKLYVDVAQDIYESAPILKEFKLLVESKRISKCPPSAGTALFRFFRRRVCRSGETVSRSRVGDHCEGGEGEERLLGSVTEDNETSKNLINTFIRNSIEEFVLHKKKCRVL